MQKIIVFGLCISLLCATGCKKEEVVLCTLTEQSKQELSETSQEFYVDFVKATVEAMEFIKDESVTYEAGLQELQKVYTKVPKDWSWNEATIEDKAIAFFMNMVDCYMGCQNYTNYADCKDAVELLINDIVAEFEDEDRVREALSFSESRFKEIYDRGKKMLK